MHAPTIETIMQPYRGYPKVIQQAILRAETHPSFSILTKSGKRVLKDLMTRVSKANAAEPIKANLGTIADNMETSYKTVQRTINALIGAGWLVKLMDNVMGDRAQFGCFKSIQYRFTPEFCKLVELPFVDENKEATDEGQEMSTGSYIDFIDLTFKKDQQEISLKNKEAKTPIDLPAELKELTEYQLAESGICKLRGHAHDRGYRLEDIWTVAKERIKAINAKGNRVYQYLLSMIVKQSDYAARAAQVGRIQDVKPPKPSKVAKQVQKSLEVAENQVKEAISELPTGRSANMDLMKALLKRSGMPVA